jgi:hypothetical protein
MRKVKDKRIEVLPDWTYLAIVEYYQDTEKRDKHEPKKRQFQTITTAQRWLAKFPRDVWDGQAVSEAGYREIDDVKRRNWKRAFRDNPRLRRRKNNDFLSRTFT